jgi:hypothetical protein
MSRKIILRQSVKSGVAVVFFFGLGMASINAQTTQTTQPTGKVGINTTNPTETLDVKGKVRIQELYTDNQQTGTNNATFTATNVVTVDNNGVLGKKLLSDITAAQTPNLPWKEVGTTNNAVPADGLKMYSRYAVGIGEYGASGSEIGSSFEINEGGTTQLGLINTKNNIVTKWHISTEDRALTFTKRKPEEGRIFSLTQDAKLFLGNNLFSEGGSNAKVILDGGNGKIGIGKNSAEYNLDVEGDAKISGLKTTSDNITNGSTTSKYSPAKMVVVDENGVLGKQDFPTIPTMPTIPTEPWQVAGSSTQATSNTSNIYQNGKVGIGNYSANNPSMESSFEINGGGSKQLGLINTINNVVYKWDISTEDKALTFTKRKPDNDRRIFSLTQDAKLYLGSGLTSEGGGGAKLILDGGNGKIGINQNSASYNLDVNGDAKISGLKSGSGYTAAHMVVADANGVLGKQALPTIPTMPTIPTEPWQVAGSSTQATSNSQDIYQSGKVGIGSFGSGKNLTHKLEVEGNTELRGKLYITDNGNTSNNDSFIYTIIQRTEGQQLLFEKNIYVKALKATQTGVMASLTNTGKIYLGKNLTKEDNVASSTNNNFYSKDAKILLDGENGTVGIGKNSTEYSLDVNGHVKISNLPTSGGDVEYYTTENNSIVKKIKNKKYAPAKMVVVDDNGVLGKADIPTGGGSGNGVKNHTGSNDDVQCNAANAGTIHYKEGVTVNKHSTSVMGFCMKTAGNKYRWFYIFGGAGTTAGSEANAPNFGEGIQ